MPPVCPVVCGMATESAFTNAHLAVHELLEAPAGSGDKTRLGPARIVAVEGRRVVVSLDGGAKAAARLALAQSYAPVVGDEVLVIGREDAWYVIGLLEGTGTTTFVAPGDIELAAPRGRIELLARDGVFIKSGLVDIVAEKLQFTARHLFERLTDLTQWVSGAVHQRAGRVRAHVEGDYDLKAGRITELADDDVTIDGKRIHLG
ncbi:MAG: DUF3540 domain-containing protein [Planctomycetia bacterium]|nr:DUF3540 domain-containing protein [Planctomycetia bacterium]